MLDVDVNREEEKAANALVSYRMTSFMLSSTAITDARGGVSVICTSDNKSGGVAVLEQEAPEGFAATAGFDASGAACPAKVSVGCAQQLCRLTTVVPNWPCGYLRLPPGRTAGF